MFKLENQVTGKIAKTGNSLTEVKQWAIKNGLYKVEKSRYFRHIICGDWDIKRI